MNSTRRFRAVALLTAVLPIALTGLVGGSVAQAAAPAVTCGSTLTSDAVLTRDLPCSTGITLSRGVTLDLGGHTLTGDGTGEAIRFSADGNSAVVNGTVKNWAGGVFQDSGDYGPADPRPSHIQNVSFINAGTSALWYGTRVVVRNSLFDNSSVSVYLSSVAISGSRFTGSTIDSLYAAVDIERSSFADNPDGAITALGPEYTSVTVRDSTFTRSGIAVQGGDGMTITGNKFSGNVTGVFISDKEGAATDSVVSGNVFLGNSSSGIRSAATGLTVGKNKSANNGRYGIDAPAAKDLGGNIAYGNKLGNCNGVICSSY